MVIPPPRRQSSPSRVRLRSERGQALTEVVLALPILCVLLVAIVQFGAVMNDWVEVSQAARVGARTASVSRKDPDRVDAASEAARRSLSKLDQDKAGVVVKASEGWTKGAAVTVEVTYPYRVDVLGLFVKSGTMTSTAVARVQ